MEPLTLLAAAGVIAALVAVLRTSGLPARYAGLVAAGIGVGGGLLGAIDGSWLAGLIAGLTASGAYSAAKNAGEKREDTTRAA